MSTNFNDWAQWRDSLRQTYQALGDDISRTVFDRRFLWSIFNGWDVPDDWKEIIILIYESNPKTNALKSPRLCFYGAGKGAEWFLNRNNTWVLSGDPSKQPVIDNHKTGMLHNHPIITFEEFLKIPDYKKYLVIITLGKGHARQEVEMLLNQHGIRYLMVYDELDLGHGTYFDLPYMDLHAEYFADLGALDGETTKIFFKYCPDGHSYVFEPSPKQFEITKERLQEYSQVELFPYAAYDKNTTLHFDPSEGYEPGARISETGSIEVETRKLDDLLGDRKVTLIKMDIEGAELAALRGAERIIREQRPKLAICVYHKPEDIWEIPDLILQYHSDYKLYLRHYTNSFGDTVLYAI